MATSGLPQPSNDEVNGRFYLQTDLDLEEKKNLSKYASCSFADIQSTRELRRAIGDDIKDECKYHGDKLKELYCKDHNVFLCTICVALDHRTCEIGYIPKLSEDIFDSQEYKSFKHSLEVITKSLSCIKSRVSQKISAPESQANNALAKLKKFRKEINDYLDKVERDVVDKIRKVKTEDQNKIEQLSKRCEILSKEVQNLNHNLADKEKKNQKCQLFVDIQTHTQAQTLDKYRKEVSKISYKNRVRQMEFAPSPELADLISKQCDIGTVTSDFRYGSKTVDLSQNVRPIISIECISDGICVVREVDGDLTLINTNIQNVIDRKKSERVSFFKELSNAFSDGGSYISYVSKNEIAVMVQHGIDIFSTTNGLQMQKATKLSPKKKLLALAYANNKFVVATDTTPPTVHTVDMNGEIMTTFPAKVDGKPLFKKPRFLAVNPDQTLIYVSDLGTDTMTCLTFTGEIRASHKAEWTPHGVTVSRDGIVYVCSNTHIRVFSSDLLELGFIPGKKHSLTWPTALAYCGKQHKLYVASGSPRDNIVVIDL